MKAPRRTSTDRRLTAHMGAMVLVASLALAACGGGEGNGADGDAAAEPTETEQGGAGNTDCTLGEIKPPSEDVPEELLSAAQAEGELHWYTAATTYELIAAAFKEAYDIDVVANRQNSGAITQLYMTEADAGAVVADVMQAFNPLLYEEAVEKGHFATLDAEEIPNLGKVPEELITSEYYVPSNSWIWGTVWNTDLVTDPIETWDDLLRPELKGEIVMADPRLGGVTAAFVNWMYDTLGEDYMRDLGEQELEWVDSNVAALDRLAAGEFSVVLPTNSNNPDPLIEQGAPLQFGAPDETSWFSHDVAISAEANSPNAARLFANYLLSLEVQEGVSFAGPPVRPDACAAGMEMLPTYTQLVPEDVVEGVEREDLWIELLQIS